MSFLENPLTVISKNQLVPAFPAHNLVNLFSSLRKSIFLLKLNPVSHLIQIDLPSCTLPSYLKSIMSFNGFTIPFSYFTLPSYQLEKTSHRIQTIKHQLAHLIHHRINKLIPIFIIQEFKCSHFRFEFQESNCSDTNYNAPYPNGQSTLIFPCGMFILHHH